MSNVSPSIRGCRNPLCTLPDGGRCARAAEFADPGECPDLIASDSDLPSSVTTGRPAPWAGQRLNVAEAIQVLQGSPARVLGVVGPRGAGKTSLVASFFLQLANGQRDGLPYRFASSRTLRALHDLAQHAHGWDGGGDRDVVPHTPKEADGHYIHLGLRPESIGDDRHIDVLMTDLAGERFTQWGDMPTSAAEIRFVGRANGFLVVADAEHLMSGAGRRYDRDISYLIERSAELQKSARAFGLVFSKLDRVDPTTRPGPDWDGDATGWAEIRQRAPRCFAALEDVRAQGLEARAFATASFPRPLSRGQPFGVVAPFAFLLRHADARRPSPAHDSTIVEPVTSWFERVRRTR